MPPAVSPGSGPQKNGTSWVCFHSSHPDTERDAFKVKEIHFQAKQVEVKQAFLRQHRHGNRAETSEVMLHNSEIKCHCISQLRNVR